MRMGNDTVGFVTIALGDEDRLGVSEPEPSTVLVTGCRFRPLAATEVETDTDVVTEQWRCTAPPLAVVLAAKATGELTHGGETYRITGVKPFTDERGRPYKVTVDCEITVS